jgi:glycosyltransferase involved in cell wall biosynthesis
MRIVLLPSAYAPAVGGVEVLTARLASQIQERGHRVEVWTARSPSDALPHEEVVGGIDVRRFIFAMPGMNLRSIARTCVAGASTVRELGAEFRRFRPELLHVQCFSGNGAYATMLSLVNGTPLLVSLQGETIMDDHDIYDHSVAMRAALRLGLRRASAVTGCSAFTIDDAVARFGLHRPKAEVVHNGVDEMAPGGSKVDIDLKRYVFAVGRVVRKKGFDLLVDAFARIADLHPGVGLVIAGDGPERESLAARAANLGLSGRIRFPGALRQDQVAAYMRRAEIFVMPSRVEPFGIVTLEAWRAGTPVIVTSRGGACEFVENGVSGLLCDPFDTQALASAITSLLDSPERRMELAAAAARQLPEFFWPQITTQYLDLYQRIGQRGAHPAALVKREG